MIAQILPGTFGGSDYLDLVQESLGVAGSEPNQRYGARVARWQLTQSAGSPAGRPRLNGVSSAGRPRLNWLSSRLFRYAFPVAQSGEHQTCR